MGPCDPESVGMPSLSRALPAFALLAAGVAFPADASAACSSPLASTDWPVYGRDAANTRHQPAGPSPADAPGLRPAWTFSVSAAGGRGDIQGTPIVAAGCVFVGTNGGWVHAFDAQTGTSRWARELPGGGAVNSTVAYANGRIYAHVSIVDRPYLVALDATDGTVLWEAATDEQAGADAFASPIVVDDPLGAFVFVGVSGDAAQHSGEDEIRGLAGSFALIDAIDGSLLRRVYTITPAETLAGFGGATISVPPAIDTDGFGYAGTSSAYIPQHEHPNNNALLKIDLRRSIGGLANPAFGNIVDRYKGDTFDAVIPGYASMPCVDLPTGAPPAIVPVGRGIGACGDVDVDFASAPNLLPDGSIVAMQKSGTVHAIDSDTMKQRWRITVAPAQPFGGVSASFDGSRIVGGSSPPGQLHALSPHGALEWLAPIGDGAHYGIPVATANGVAYSVGVTGFLHAFDAATGAPLLVHPLTLGRSDLPVTFAGVSVSGDTVFAAVGFQSTGLDAAALGNGLVVAFRPTS